MGLPIYPEMKHHYGFKWKDLHGKVGQIVVMEPTDSDLAEGSLPTHVWFVDADRNMYLLAETE